MRTEAVFLSAMIAGAWLVSTILGMGGPKPAQATELAARQSIPPSQAFDQADVARKRGDLAQADRLYRLAWVSPGIRARSAAELRTLERAGYDRPADEKQVADTAALLGPRFHRYRTDHFILLSDAAQSQTRAKLGALERAHHQFFRTMGRLGFDAVPARTKLLCVLFADHAMYRAFAKKQDNVDAAWVAGYYAGRSNRAVFYEDDTGPSFAAANAELDSYESRLKDLRSQATTARRARRNDDAKLISAQAEQLRRQIRSERSRIGADAKQSSISKTIHEAVHLLAFNTGVQSRSREYPFWLTEGLATSFETDRPNAAFGPDRPSTLRLDVLRESVSAGRTIPLRELVALTAPPNDDPSTTGALYAQTWSLFTYLYRTDRRSLAEFFNDALVEPTGASTPERRLEMFEYRFGDVDRLEHRWLRQLGISSTPN